MGATGRPGPKPKRLYARIARFGEVGRDDLPTPRQEARFLDDLDRVGRLVARGPLSDPPGELLIFRARDRGEAERTLRVDPYRHLENCLYEIFEWDPVRMGTGVNIEPPPARGAGRLTALQRVAVVVRDRAAATVWYRDVLGLALRIEDPETDYVELSLGPGAAALSLIAPHPSWGEPYYSEGLARIGSITGIVFQTDSVAALELRLRNAGARITQPPRAEPWGGVALRFADPDGNEFLAFERTLPRRRGRTVLSGA